MKDLHFFDRQAAERTEVGEAAEHFLLSFARLWDFIFCETGETSNLAHIVGLRKTGDAARHKMIVVVVVVVVAVVVVVVVVVVDDDVDHDDDDDDDDDDLVFGVEAPRACML